MHEHLIEDRHPACIEEIRNLRKCHEEGGMWQMFGICNDAKHFLDMCFRKERSARRAANFAKGQERKAKWAATMKDLDSDEPLYHMGLVSRTLRPGEKEPEASTPKAEEPPSPSAERIV